MHVSIPLGIVIGLLASFVQSLGLTIQRKSHVQNQSLPSAEQRVEHRRPLWLLGFAVFISSNILGSLVQIASLPVVILAPLGAVSLLWNAFFARLILGDVFSPWMILGTLLIAGGAVLIAVFGIVPEQTRSLEDLLELFRRPTFVAYFSLLGAVVLGSLIVTHITEYSFSRKVRNTSSSESSPPPTASMSLNVPADPSTLTTGVDDTLAQTLTTERTPLLDPKADNSMSRSPSIHSQRQSSDTEMRSLNRTRLLIAISFASFSGIISGMCLLFAKSGVELLLLTLRGQNQFWRWQAWTLVLGLVVFALLQLWYMHKALILADPTLVCPSAFCFYNLSSIVNGLVYFDQFSLIPPIHLFLVTVGIFVLLGGVWVVSIQSGGGGVDLGAWDRDIEDDSASTSDSEHFDIEEVRPDTSVFLPDVDESSSSQAFEETDRLAVERLTKSESNIRDLTTYPSRFGIDADPPLRSPVSTLSQPVGLPSSSPHRPSLRGTRRNTSYRPTVDTHPSRHTPGASHNVSFSHSSITSNPVASLGTGFQIGLSPVSPGFAIVPRERGRKVSGLVPGSGDEMSDARRRRRTVSEGDVFGRALDLERGQAGYLGDTSEENQNSPNDEDVAVQGKGKSTPGRAKTRWRWLTRVFTSRN